MGSEYSADQLRGALFGAASSTAPIQKRLEWTAMRLRTLANDVFPDEASRARRESILVGIAGGADIGTSAAAMSDEQASDAMKSLADLAEELERKYRDELEARWQRTPK